MNIFKSIVTMIQTHICTNENEHGLRFEKFGFNKINSLKSWTYEYLIFKMLLGML